MHLGMFTNSYAYHVDTICSRKLRDVNGHVHMLMSAPHTFTHANTRLHTGRVHEHMYAELHDTHRLTNRTSPGHAYSHSHTYKRSTRIRGPGAVNAAQLALI